MPDEEVSFKSIKLTLSEDAIDKLEELRNLGHFRSDSMTVEESLRILHSILNDVDRTIGEHKGKKSTNIRIGNVKRLLELIVARLDRFTGYTITFREGIKDDESAAGAE